MSENKIFSNAKNKNKCLRNKLHPVVLQSTYQSCQLGPIPLEQKKHNRPYFLNSKVQLNMVTWQTDRGALSFLSERGNFRLRLIVRLSVRLCVRLRRVHKALARLFLRDGVTGTCSGPKSQKAVILFWLFKGTCLGDTRE